MLELPESYTIAKQIEQTLKGKIISEIEMLHTPHKFAFVKEHSENYSDVLEGQMITGAVHILSIMRIKRSFLKNTSLQSISMMKPLYLYLFRCMAKSTCFLRGNVKMAITFHPVRNRTL